VLAGEPLVDWQDGVLWRPRDADTDYLHQALRQGNRQVLQRASGIWCMAQYDANGHMLRLITDQLGTRPLYEARVGDCVVFASALRILEAIPGLDLRLDVRGITEQAILQAPLDGRTTYLGVHLLRPGEIIEHSAPGRTSRVTREWDRVPHRHLSDDEAIDAVHTAFIRAVDRRRRDDTAAVSFLSGGLDSRIIVAAMRNAGLSVQTLNFSLVGSLDHAIGGLFAEAVGTFHVSRPYHAGLDDDYAEMACAVLRESPAISGVIPERPRLLWAGYGGSAFIGQIHSRPEYAALCRNGDLPGAVDAFFRVKIGDVPTRLFRKPFGGTLARDTRGGVLSEIERLSPEDPGRLMELYLLHNATRCQMHAHHEATDLRRVELQVPFFDADFVAVALGIPSELLAGHRLYHRWLERFGPPVTTIPWQAYPNHEPCPLPPPAGARPQWELASEQSFRRKALLRAARRLVGGPLPTELLDRRYLGAVSLAHWLGLRNYGYAIRLAHRYTGAWLRTGRKAIPLPEVGSAAA